MVQVQSSWFPLMDRKPQRFAQLMEAVEDFQPANARPSSILPGRPSSISPWRLLRAPDWSRPSHRVHPCSCTASSTRRCSTPQPMTLRELLDAAFDGNPPLLRRLRIAERAGPTCARHRVGCFHRRPACGDLRVWLLLIDLAGGPTAAVHAAGAPSGGLGMTRLRLASPARAGLFELTPPPRRLAGCRGPSFPLPTLSPGARLLTGVAACTRGSTSGTSGSVACCDDVGRLRHGALIPFLPAEQKGWSEAESRFPFRWSARAMRIWPVPCPAISVSRDQATDANDSLVRPAAS